MLNITIFLVSYSKKDVCYKDSKADFLPNIWFKICT